MHQRNYLGDERLRHRIDYIKGGISRCIYCGERADSREHIPSKAFLKKPFPENLYTVPACKKCNNSFSQDELYTRIVIDTLQSTSIHNSLCVCDNGASAKHPQITESVFKEVSCFKIKSEDAISPFHFRSDRIKRIVEKLARGHAVYELSEAFNVGGEGDWLIASSFYSFKPMLSQETIDDYDCAVDIRNCLLPEIGSRVYDKIYPIQIPISQIDENHLCVLRSVLLDWTDIQDGAYRYIAIIDGNRIQVNMVIDEFLFASVFFVERDDPDCLKEIIRPLEQSTYSLQDVPCALVNATLWHNR